MAISEPRTAEPQDSAAGESVAALLARLEGRLHRILWHRGVSEHDAEDIVQDTLLIFLQKRPEIERPEAWLLATLRNRSIMYHRKRQRGRELFEEPAHEIPLELRATVEGGQRRVESRLLLGPALARLPEREQSAIRLRYLEEHSVREVAPRLGYEASTVRKLLRRTLDSLRALLVDGSSSG